MLPFTITDAMVDSYAKILSRFGNSSNYKINTREADDGGRDGSVTIGFDLPSDQPMPEYRPKVPLIYGGKYVGMLHPDLGQVRVIGVDNCRVCKYIGGNCPDPQKCKQAKKKKDARYHRRVGVQARTRGAVADADAAGASSSRSSSRASSRASSTP